jgi:hypothetical protein
VRPATCEACHARIVWAISEKSQKPAPIDADPVLMDGNVLLIEVPGKHPTARYVAKGAGTHVSHFAPCPKAASFRRK